MIRLRARIAACVAALLPAAGAHAAPPRCLSECTPRIGIVSAFGPEADILLAESHGKRDWKIHGKRFTTGVLRGNRIVIVLSGVSMVNAALTTQMLLDHFRIERLVMSGISGGVDPAHKVGDVMVPASWAMPMEVYWHHDASLPALCGKPGDLSCLGMRLANVEGRVVPSFVLAGSAPTGLFMRETRTTHPGGPTQGEFAFEFHADPAMLDVARTIDAPLARCGPKATAAGGPPDPRLCVGSQPAVVVGGRGVSGTAFLANADYRAYLFKELQAQTVDMETAALAQVAYSNGIPFIAFRSLSDLAGAVEFNADVGALFSSGLAEANESTVTLAFLQAWAARQRSAKQ